MHSSLDLLLGWYQVAALGFFLDALVVQSVRVRIRRRVNPITLAAHGKGLQGFMELSLFLGVNLWGGLVLLNALPLRRPPPAWLTGPRLFDAAGLRLAGAAAIAVAFAVFVLALASLGESWRLGLDEHGPARLVTRGIYAVSRNPIYLFFDLYFAGSYLVNGTPHFLAFAVLGAANLHYQILQEERVLAQAFGPAYEAYRGRTGRYLTLPHRPLPRPVAAVRRRAAALWIRE